MATPVCVIEKSPLLVNCTNGAVRLKEKAFLLFNWCKVPDFLVIILDCTVG